MCIYHVYMCAAGPACNTNVKPTHANIPPGHFLSQIFLFGFLFYGDLQSLGVRQSQCPLCLINYNSSNSLDKSELSDPAGG
jgi:hypothetical protein